jgi:site-specific recombinase XerD
MAPHFPDTLLRCDKPTTKEKMMLDTFFTQCKVQTRMQSGLLGPCLPSLAEMLHCQGYSKSTIRRRLRAAEQFGIWLQEQGIAVVDVDRAIVSKYRQGLKRWFPPSRPRGLLSRKALGLFQLVELLRQKGVLRPEAEPAPSVGVERWLEDFDHHLDQAAGYTPKTRDNYLRCARRLLTGCFGIGEPDWSAFQSEPITEFIRKEADRLQPSGCGLPVTAIRALIRFLAAKGVVPAGLQGAVPAVRTWPHSSLPRHISAAEVERVIKACDLSTPWGLRERAVVVLLARLGLRAGEIVRLKLDDLDWTEGGLIVRAGKNHRERVLPLSTEVGDAIVAYLRQARRPSSHRELFLSWRPPFGPLRSSVSITNLVGAVLKRAGIKVHRPGAHILRHTLATGMVRQGVTFKEIADVLGHRSLASTGIYAKLDLESLEKVALPWPGGVQ